MKYLATGFLCATLTVAGCATVPERPSAADQFIGKSLVAEDGTTFLFQPAGVVGGTIRGEDIVGTYTSSATEICSTYSSPDFLTGREFCSTPDVSAGVVVFNRRDGSQSQAYRIDG